MFAAQKLVKNLPHRFVSRKQNVNPAVSKIISQYCLIKSMRRQIKKPFTIIVYLFYYNLNYIRPKVQKRTGKVYEKTLKFYLVSAIKALCALEVEEVSNFSKEQ